VSAYRPLPGRDFADGLEDFDPIDIGGAFGPPAPRRIAPLGPGAILRTLAALCVVVAIGFAAYPAFASGLRLKGDVTARGDVLTLGELVEGAEPALAGRALFRAPALGATGTIQARRIAEAVAALGLGTVETGGRVQVAVQRAARRVGPPEIEAALKRSLETGYGLDARTLSVRLDGEGQALLAPLDLNGQATALDVTYDPRSRRITGLISLGERQASLRVSGVVLEMREVAVLARTLNRGERIEATDIAIERRPREGVPPDAQAAAPAPGEVAQRTLGAGSMLRAGDTAPPEVVLRGETVTIVYETPGVSLSMRGQANESGRLGATVSVLNVASKKALQATVIGPGRVSVGPAAPVRQASAALDTP